MRNNTRRNYKDTLFRYLFKEPKELLNLYNALCSTAYTDVNCLEITTLEDVIYIGMKNDVSFMIDSVMNLYEHQSTLNPNIPIRGVFYFGKLYQTYIAMREENIYGSKKITLPMPRFLVFCNDFTMKEERKTYSLSELFERKPSQIASLECIAEVININHGHNKEIMEKCRTLREYSLFINEVRVQTEIERERLKAIEKAVEISISRNILKDFLVKHRAEVCDMILEEFNEEKYIAMVKRDAKTEGREEGREELALLIQKLLRENRNSEFEKIINDSEYRKILLKEPMQLYIGRQENLLKREAKEIRVYDLLDSLKIPYMRTDHEPADTMEACNEIDKILETVICKNLFLCNRQKTEFYLLMMPRNKNFKTKELSVQINSARLSFASAEDMEKYLDIAPGAVSILGLMNDKNNQIKLLADEDVLKGEYIGCHPCVNTSSLKIKTIDIVEKFLKAVHHEMQIVTLKGE